MNKEIKEILNGLNVVIKHGGSVEINSKECKKIIDYITNLQERKITKEDVDKYFEENMCVSFDKFIENCDEQEKLTNYYKKKNEELKKKITFNEKSRRKMQQSLMEQIEIKSKGFKATVEELCETSEKLEQLQEENQRLKEENEKLLKKSYSDDVKITKAIEYIKNFKYGMPYTEWVKKEELLNILNGGDEE